MSGHRSSSARAYACILTLAAAVAGCHAQLVLDPAQPVQPNPLDRTEPELQVRVYFDANTFDTLVKPRGTFFVLANRCFHVANPLRVQVTGSDLQGGISYLSVGTHHVAPSAGTIVATPAPDSATQADDPASPNVTYPNPGVAPGSRTAEVTYYTGTPPGRPRGLATLSAEFNFGGNTSVVVSARARNTSVSAASASMDGYFVRPADAMHPPGTACTPPP